MSILYNIESKIKNYDLKLTRVPFQHLYYKYNDLIFE